MKQIPSKTDFVDEVDASEFNSISFELQNIVTDSGQSLSEGDQHQVSKAASIYTGSGDFYTDTGTAVAYQLDPIGSKKAPPNYEIGQRARFIAANANSGAATARIGTLSPKDIKHDNGSDLIANQIVAGNFITLMYNGTNWVLIDDGQGGSIFTNPLPTDYRSGCSYNQDSGDTDHDIEITAGKWRSSDDSINLILSSALTKQIDANWAEGDNAGGFPSGLTLIADTAYHMFLIGKTNGFTDAGFDSSITASNLLADATGYTKYRRIGTIYTDYTSTNIRDFTMINKAGNGRLLLWKDIYTDYYNNAPGTGSGVLVALKIPPGVNVLANFNVYYHPAGVDNSPIYISSPFQVDQAPNSTAAEVEQTPPKNYPLFTFISNSSAARTGGFAQIISNANKQIRFRVANNAPVVMATLGWEE